MVRPSELDAETDVYQWAFPVANDREADLQRIRALNVLRDYVEGLEPYTATFRVSNAAENSELTPENFTREMLWLVGSWEIPPVYTQSRAQGIQWVNPNYAHIEQYSDSVVECECGSTVTKARAHSEAAVFNLENEHENCRIEWRFRAVADLYAKRRKILRQMALLNQSGRSQAERLRVNENDVGSLTRRLGMDLTDLRKRGREKRDRTLSELARAGCEMDRLERAFDLSERRIQQLVYEDTGQWHTELRHD